MKPIQKISTAALVTFAMLTQYAFAQKNIDDERMLRDIEVAENVLATLIKQELEQQKTIFGLDVTGSYQPGYGVTFRIPSDQFMPIVFTISGDDVRGARVISDGNTYRYSYRTNGSNEAELADNTIKLEEGAKKRTRMSADSARIEYNERLITAAQTFLLDYGDFLSQLGPSERIVVTNQSDRVPFYFNAGKRTRISVEGTRHDLTAYRQGKLTREQALKKLTVVNTESVETREPDMEMLSSIFSRLYRPDLSQTYFVDGNVYYERLKDFGAIFYLRVLSSEERSPNRFALPTIGVDNLDKANRDKKVTELYPVFEQDLKKNIIEYGRTVKSLKDDESLIFNVVLTRCEGCGIPSTLELSVKGSVLKEFGAGKIDEKSALGKITIKKGVSQ